MSETQETQEVVTEVTASEDQLEKALADLESQIKGPESEKQELLSKAMSASLSKEESDRLMTLLAGVKEEESLAKSATDELRPENNEIIKSESAVDVSGYLRATNEALVKGMETIATSVEKNSNTQGEFNLVLAKAIAQLGETLKAQSARIADQAKVIRDLSKAVDKYGEQAPVGPKSKFGTPKMEKSFGGKTQSDGLSQAEIITRLNSLHEQSYLEGRGGLSKSGSDLLSAIAGLESGQDLPGDVMQEVLNFKK